MKKLLLLIVLSLAGCTRYIVVYVPTNKTIPTISDQIIFPMKWDTIRKIGEFNQGLTPVISINQIHDSTRKKTANTRAIYNPMYSY